MKYRGTIEAMCGTRLEDPNASFDDSQIHRLLAVENEKITGDEAVAQIIKEAGWKDEDLG
jgi:hypothetical protein